MIVAIDGPAGAGKSTVARALAARLGWLYLDTGAMYRALTLCALERGVDVRDERACAELAARTSIDFGPDGGVRVDGVTKEPWIRRDPAVAAAVSIVSAYAGVRQAIVARQRALAQAADSTRGLVAEGRDTATAVFPRAELKVFLTASLATRARRRAAELERPAGEVEAEIARRDGLDSTRSVSPLEAARDSIHIATDQRSAEQVVDEICAHVARLSAPTQAAEPSGRAGRSEQAP